MPFMLNPSNNPSPQAPAPVARTGSKRRLLVVDDDGELRQLLSTYLTRHGFDVLLLPNTAQLDQYLDRYNPHLIVLDLMMPGEDGLAACRRLRGRGDTLPIIMLTARDEPVDRIVGLEMGADDYVGKPFEPRELLARIEAVLRRNPSNSFDGASKPFRFGPFECDFEARELRRDEKAVTLTGGEFTLLTVLIRNANRPLKRERLLELTRGGESDSLDRAIDMQVYRLRRAIEDDPGRPRYIRTIWGVGYVFVPNPEGAEAPEDQVDGEDPAAIESEAQQQTGDAG
jgi:two-component system, OmpR family, phosphate regulon response regulator OmpR